MKSKKKIITAILLFIAALFAIEKRYELSFMLQKAFTANPKEAVLSEDDKIEDVRYFMDTILEYTPCMDYYAENMGIDLEKNYNYYVECIKNTESNEEFFSVIEMISDDIPSCHTSIVCYEYDSVFSSGHYNAEKICGSKDAYAYSMYWDSVCDSNRDILDDASSFRYIDGAYLAYNPAIFGGKGGLIELVGIDGIVIDEYVKNPMVTGEYCYDSCNDKMYRYSLRMNNSVGKRVEAEFRKADGTLFTADVYIQTKDAPLDKGTYIKENHELLDAEEHSAVSIDFEGINEIYNGEAGYICEDINNSVSYIWVANFSNPDGEAFRDGICRLNPDNPVIIDLRMNSGGRTEYLSEYVLSPLFKDDIRVDMDFRSVSSIRNAFSESHWKEKRKFEEAVINSTDEYIYGRRYFHVDGTADTNRKIYAITDNTSVSAADTAAYAIRKYGNGILLGSETAGEGVCDITYVFKMPNSGIIFRVNGSESLYSEGNCTAPDIYINQSAESFVKYRLCLAPNTNILIYPYKMYWDNVLTETLEIIKEKENTTR